MIGKEISAQWIQEDEATPTITIDFSSMQSQISALNEKIDISFATLIACNEKVNLLKVMMKDEINELRIEFNHYKEAHSELIRKMANTILREQE